MPENPRLRVKDVNGDVWLFNGTWEALEPMLNRGDFVKYGDRRAALSLNFLVSVEDVSF